MRATESLRVVPMVAIAPAVVFGIAVASNIGAGPAMMSAEAASSGGAGGSVTVDDAIRFRQTFGLRSDEAYVELAASDVADFPHLDWGVPLSNDEAADLYARLDVQASLAPALQYGAEQDDWAGAYLDQLDKGLPVFLFTKDADRHWTDIGGLLPAGTTFGVRLASYTFADLQTMQGTIDEASKDLASKGTNLIRTSIDIQRNAVLAAVEEATSSAVDDISALAPSVLVQEAQPSVADGCNDILDCPPPKSGIAVVAPDGGVCTAGFLGRRSDGSHNDIEMVVAGHCIGIHNGGGAEWTDYHGHYHPSSSGHDIGPASGSYTWRDLAGSDVGFIKVLPANYPSQFNRILVRNNPLLGHVTHTAPSHGAGNEQIAGDQICRFGYGSWNTTGYPRTCGQIVATDVTDQDCNSGYGCISVMHLTTVSFDSHPGDSGAPMFTPEDSNGNTTLYGIHIDSVPDNPPCVGSGCEGWYSPWDRAREQLQSDFQITIWPCTTYAC